MALRPGLSSSLRLGQIGRRWMSSAPQFDKLEAHYHKNSGKNHSAALRKKNKIPALIFNRDNPKKSIKLSIDKNTLYKEIKKHSDYIHTTLYDIELHGLPDTDGPKTVRVLPTELSFCSATDELLHVRFLKWVTGKKTRLQVPVRFDNIDSNPYIRTGGLFYFIKEFVPCEYQGPDEDLPKHLTVDTEKMRVGHVIHAQNLTYPKGLTLVRPTKIHTLLTFKGKATRSAYDEEQDKIEAEKAKEKAKVLSADATTSAESTKKKKGGAKKTSRGK